MSDDIVTVKITNDYSDGHHSVTEVLVPFDTALYGGDDVDEWFEDVVYEHTGDGHGEDPNLGSCYTAEIIATHHADLLGKTYEWVS